MAYQIDIIHATKHELKPMIPVLVDHESHQAVVIDPGDADLVFEHVGNHDVMVGHILITHHHSDHVDGIAEVVKAFPKAEVYGPGRYARRIPHLQHHLTNGQTLNLGGMKVRVISTPCHTLDHLSFWMPDLESVFVGDTVFPLSVGRLFEGTPEMLWESLCKLRMLPPSTTIYFGHDLLHENAEFTLSLEPNNAFAKEALRRDSSNPLMTTTVADESANSLFWRADDADLVHRIGYEDANAVEMVAILRGLRDEWPSSHKAS